MIVSRKLNERRVGGFEAKTDSEAQRKFKKWWPNRSGYLKYKLYRQIATAAGCENATLA